MAWNKPFNNYVFVPFFRRQKEKRINPACLSPNGSNGSSGSEYTKNLFSATLPSLPSLPPQIPASEITSQNLFTASLTSMTSFPTSTTPSTTSEMASIASRFHPLALISSGFNPTSLNSLASKNETASLGWDWLCGLLNHVPVYCPVEETIIDTIIIFVGNNYCFKKWLET